MKTRRPLAKRLAAACALATMQLTLFGAAVAHAACQVPNDRLFAISAAAGGVVSHSERYNQSGKVYDAAVTNPALAQQLASRYTTPDQPISGTYVFARNGGPSWGAAIADRMEISAGREV
jgi:hypothetical protein